MRSWLWVIVLATACGRFGFDRAAGGDASGDGPGDTTSIDAPQTYRDVVLADSPIGYWRLGDSGTVARDETGHVDGLYLGNCQHGAAGALANDADRATLFDGTTCYIQLADAYERAGNAPFTIELWTAPTTLSQYQHYMTRQTRNGAIPEDGYALLLSPTGMKVERTVGGVDSATVPTMVVLDVYMHVVAVYSGASSRVYINGQPGALRDDASQIPALSFVALIGVSDPSNNYAYATGPLDEVAIYDHVLTPARIMAHYTMGVTGP